MTTTETFERVGRLPTTDPRVIRLVALESQLDVAERGIHSSLWAARQDVDGNSTYPPREAADRAIGRIRSATIYYDAVLAEVEQARAAVLAGSPV